ncbi:MAG TPA: hypothetical protein EYO90_08820 [Candidatus Latescibacteria bacterium]|nr:hypothetical protein [Candidatus Latescibacterota bacterium]
MGPEPWSCLFRIADFEFSLQGTDRQLRELAECVYSGARIADGKRGRRYQLGRAEGRFVMSCGGKEICSQPALQEFFQDVEWALTAEAMWSLDHFLQIHAAAAQVSGQKAVVLIGDHGAGKTTLVVALARLGARIFTDEVALLDPVRLELTPFRRDLILHTETQALFPDLSRGPEAPEFKRFAEYRYVSPKEIDTQNSPEPSALGSMLFPRLQPGSAVSCSPVGPAEAARRLLANSFNLGAFEEECADVVGRVVENCAAAEWVFGDAREAAARILSSVVED